MLTMTRPAPASVTSTITPTGTSNAGDTMAAHRRAVRFAAEVLGLRAAPSVCWDDEHRLQGHLEYGGRHLVLIATRTADRTPRLFAEAEWDSFRLAH
jgi:hypothetical protein